MEFTEMISAFVWLCAALGLFSFCWALCGVRREAKKLPDNQGKLQQEILGNDPNRRVRREKLAGWLSKEEIKIKRKDDKDVRVGQGYHLYLRMKTIYESVNRTNAQEVPSLHDLHTLTLQDEMSRRSSVCLRTISSFLLIVGIFGTLIGVHEVVGGVEQLSPGALRPALEPSMWAVFGTVVLMWLRGWYVSRVDTYLEKLDLFTMTKVIPLMRPVSAVGGKTMDLREQIEGLDSKIDSVRSMAETMDRLKKSVCSSAEAVKDMTVQITTASEESEKVFPDVLNKFTGARERFDKISTSVSDGFEASCGFGKCVDGLKAEIDNLQKACEGACEQYKELSGCLSAISETVRKTGVSIEKLESTAGDMVEMETHIHGYVNTLDEVKARKADVGTVMSSMEQLSTEMHESANAAYNSLVKAQEAQTASLEIVDQLDAQNTDFKDHIDQGRDGRDGVRKHVSQMEEQLTKLETAVKNLQKGFENRRKALHL